MRSLQLSLLVLATMLALGVPSFAHHPFDAEFDKTQPIHVEGRVRKITWTNPHVLVDLDVASGTTAASQVQLELPSANKLLMSGWRRQTLQPNMDIAIDGFRAKAPSSNTVGAVVVTIKGTGQVLTIDPSSWHHSFAH